MRGLNPDNPKIRCTIDALQVLEYYAVKYSREEFKRKVEELKSLYPSHVDEALKLVRILVKILPQEDPEWSLCSRIVEYLYSPLQSKLDRWLKRES